MELQPRHDLAWQRIAPVAAIFASLSFGTAFVSGYGYMADELYFLSCADRLAWGYVDHPPFSIAVLAAFRAIAGDSLAALRLIPALFGAATVFVSALLVRELGGGKSAQLLAALAWIAAPAAQAVASYHSMNVIEGFLWSLAAWLVARIVRAADPIHSPTGPGSRNWIALGVVLGLALLNKLSTLWLGFGLGLGLLLTSQRGLLLTRGPWAAAAIAFAILLPHVAWQVGNDWPLVDFIRGNSDEVAESGAVLAGPIEFAVAQLVGMSPVTLPLWLAGLGWFFVRPEGGRFRVLAWMWLGVLLTLLLSGRAQGYYLTPAFPILFAAGAVWVEQISSSRQWLTGLCGACAIGGAILVLPIGTPLLTPGTFNALQQELGIEDSDGELPPHFRWRIGWEELAAAVDDAHARLEPNERRIAGVLAIGFPAAGALQHFGPEHGLPTAIGTHNNYWLWGPGETRGDVMLIVAPPGHAVLADFARVEPGTKIPCRYCGGGTRDEMIFVARRPVRPIGELWAGWRDYR